MTAIAGRLGEFWAGFDAASAGGSVTAGATATVDNANPLNVTWTAVPPLAAFAGAVQVCGSLVDVSISGNVDELETTVHNSAPASGNPVHGTARTYIPNFHDETADVAMRYDEDDTCQENMLICAFNSYLYHFWYIPDGTATALGLVKVIWGDCFATSFSPSSPLDDTTSVDFSLRLSGTDYETNAAATTV
jgi:hypothetical protein